MVLHRTYRGGANPPEREIGLFDYFYNVILGTMMAEIDIAKFMDVKGHVNFIGSTTYELSIKGIDEETRGRIDAKLAIRIWQS